MSVKHTVSLRLSDKENTLIRNYAEIKGLSISEFLRESALLQIRQDLDLLAFEEAYDEHNKKPNTLSSDKLKELLGL